MEDFIVSARKYRPENFDLVIGQASITHTLKNAIRNNHLAHAYLFCGPRGVGKTTCARIFAKTINCTNRNEKGEACGVCESCVSFRESRSFNIHELDAASNNSVDDIRNLIDQIRIAPQIGKYSVYIIDEVHMLSQQAFNAFLKTLEEPPAHAIFILATTEKHKIIPTILSRCQIFDFNRIKVQDMVAFLEKIAINEQVQYEPEAFAIIAQKADGSMRDALSIFDQIVSFSGNNITYKAVIENLNVLDYEYYFRLVDFFLDNNYSDALTILDEIINRGFDTHNFVVGLSSHFRDLLVSKDKDTVQLIEVGDSIRERYVAQTSCCSVEFLMKGLEILNKCDIHFNTSRNKRLHVELALIELSNIFPGKKKVNLDTIEEEMPKLTGIPKTDKPASDSMPVEKSATLPSPTSVGVTPKVPVGFSIKEAKMKTAQPQAAAPVVAIDGTVVPQSDKEFTADELKAAWKAFANTIQDSENRLYITLMAAEPEKKDNVITFTVNNPLQQEIVQQKTNDILFFLKKELSNNHIQLDIYISEKSQAEKRKLYTAEDKFNYLNKKNPVMGKFRQQLNLDFE